MPSTTDPADENLDQLATRIPRWLHRQLRLFVVAHDTTIIAFVGEALREHLRRNGVKL